MIGKGISSDISDSPLEQEDDFSLVEDNEFVDELKLGNSLKGIGKQTATVVGKKYHYSKRIETHVPQILQKQSAVSEKTAAQHREFVRTYDDGELYCHIFAGDAPKAIVFVMHGFGENINSFEEMGLELFKLGFAVVMYDQRGFGRSSGQRGHMKSIEEWLVDGLTVLKRAKVHLESTSQLDIYLYGHSSGSLGALLLAYELSKVKMSGKFDRDEFTSMMQHQKTKQHKDQQRLLEHLSKDLLEFAPLVKGCIATAPYFKVGAIVSEWEKKVVKLISKVAEKYTVGVEIPVERLTTDPAMQKELTKDHLRISDMTVKQLSEWDRVATILLSQDVCKQFTCPIAVLHGTKDTVASAHASKQFYDCIASTDKQYYFCKDFSHGIHIEEKRSGVFTFVSSWMTARLQPSAELHVENIPSVETEDLTTEHSEIDIEV